MFLLHFDIFCDLLGRLSMRVFEAWTAAGSELFSLLTCPHTTTFTLLSTFSPLEISILKMWETTLSWHAKCSLRVAVRVSKTPVLKLFTNRRTAHGIYLFYIITEQATTDKAFVYFKIVQHNARAGCHQSSPVS